MTGNVLPLVLPEIDVPYRREIRVQQITLDTSNPRITVRISGGGYTVHVSRLLSEGEVEGQTLDRAAVLELLRTSVYLNRTVASEISGDTPEVVEPSWEGTVRVCESGSSAQ